MIIRYQQLHLDRRPVRLLVVSDNPELTLFLKNEIDAISLNFKIIADFRYTVLNKNPENLIEIGAKPIDMKDKINILTIPKNYDIIFSLHCKQIFPKDIVERTTCINFHPGFNPFNRGWFPQVFSILNGKPAGATIHLMDTHVDHGDIIAQKNVEIDDTDTSFELYRKVILAEKDLIHHNLEKLVKGTFVATPVKQEGNYNSMNDFRKLCALDLSSVGTLGEHLNLLRAMTHGDFKNAYFVDSQGQRHFVRVVIESEEIPT